MSGTLPALTDVGPKLAKLLPRLGSNFDGEVIATARAIGRTLKSAGHDWHDLVATLVPEQAEPADWRSLARYCADHQHQLSPRELDFIVNIAQQPWDPSEKQLKWLNDIAARLRHG